MTNAKIIEDCYGMPSKEDMTPPRPWLTHPKHDWVRTVSDGVRTVSNAGETLICCLTCCEAVWVATTDEMLGLPLCDLMLGGDLAWKNRKSECGDNHWVSKEG